MTLQKLAREAVTEPRYRLVFYASSDEEEGDACDARSGPIPTSAAREQEVLTGTQRRFLLDDYTPVIVGQPADTEVDLEIDIRPEDEDF